MSSFIMSVYYYKEFIQGTDRNAIMQRYDYTIIFIIIIMMITLHDMNASICLLYCREAQNL